MLLYCDDSKTDFASVGETGKETGDVSEFELRSEEIINYRVYEFSTEISAWEYENGGRRYHTSKEMHDQFAAGSLP